MITKIDSPACISTTTQNHKYELINQTEDNPKSYLEASADWLRVHFKGQSENFRRVAICQVIGTDPAYVIKNGKFTDYQGDKGYTHKIQGEYGQHVLWRKAEVGWDIRINLTGQFISLSMDLTHFCKFLQWCDSFDGHVTRIDLNITDHLKRIDWQDFHESCEADSYTTVHDYYPGHVYRKGKIVEVCSYLGSRRSESFTRIYETSKKHGYKANRIETEFKGKKARKVASELIRNFNNFYKYKGFDDLQKQNNNEVNDKLARWIAYVVVGQIDFVDRSDQYKNGSLGKCKRLPWWQEFIDGIGGIVQITVERVKNSLRDNFNWIKKQVSKTLAVYSQGLGKEDAIALIEMLIDDASRKLTDKDKMRIAILNDKGISALVSNDNYG